LAGKSGGRLMSISLYDELLLGKVIQNNELRRGQTPEAAQHTRAIVKLLIRHGEDVTLKSPAKIAAHSVLADLFKSSVFQHFSGVNEFESKLWFKKEATEEAVRWLMLSDSFLQYRKYWRKTNDADDKTDPKQLKKLTKKIKKLQKVRQYWLNAIAESQYLVKELIEVLHKQAQLKQAKMVADEKESRTAKKRKKQSKKKQTIISKVTTAAKNNKSSAKKGDEQSVGKKAKSVGKKSATRQPDSSKKPSSGKNAKSSKDD
jgi:hypothetical protein